MPLPVRLNLVTVTGNYMDGQGNPRSGTVTFTAPELYDSTDGTTISSTNVVATLPTFSVSLVATDNTGLQPAGAPVGTPWFYTIDESVVGDIPQSYEGIKIPHTPSPVDVSALL